MTLLDDPVPSFELEPEPPTPRGMLARAVPIVVVFALLGLIGTAGTWASFTASTDNPATFATGSLVLENTVTGEDECLSNEGGGGLNVNENDCVAIFTFTPGQPGHETGHTLVLENVGSMDGSALKVFAPEACASTPVGSYSGTSELCDRLQLVIQERDGLGDEVECLYGGGDATTCAFDDGFTVSDFVDDHGTWNDAATFTGGLDVNQERHLEVAVRLDPLAGNDYQGLLASIALTWRLEQ